MKLKRINEATKAQITEFLKNAVSQIKTSEDPYELNAYRKIFRSNVPFSLRSYFAAYLLKFVAEGKPLPRIPRGERPERRDRSERFGAKTSVRRESYARSERSKPETDFTAERESVRREERVPRESSHPVLPEELSATLFISVGKNRRVFPKDIITLIMQNVEIDRDHIGDIRILESYSFVQVLSEDAERVIAALSAVTYRGRKLNVSYSRKKDEKDERDETNAAQESSESDAPHAENTEQSAAPAPAVQAEASADSEEHSAQQVSVTGQEA